MPEGRPVGADCRVCALNCGRDAPRRLDSLRYIPLTAMPRPATEPNRDRSACTKAPSGC